MVSVLDSGAVGPGFKSQSRRCRVAVLGKLFTPIVPHISGWLGSRVVSVLDSGAVGPGFKSQPRRRRVTVLGKLFTPASLCAVCATAGYILSYWNRAFFPTACADDSLSDKTNYDTLVRVSGSSSQIALAVKEVIDM